MDRECQYALYSVCIIATETDYAMKCRRGFMDESGSLDRRSRMRMRIVLKKAPVTHASSRTQCQRIRLRLRVLCGRGGGVLAYACEEREMRSESEE